MKKFEQPKYKIVELEDESNYGKFVIEPLEKGFGTTIGNALRRVLLSSLPGASVYSVEIAGARHEFSALDGVEEDITSIILNLKDLVLTIDDDENVSKELHIDVIGPCEITGADIECPLGVDVVNKDLHIATLTKGTKFNAVLHAKNSRGYVTSENNSVLEENNVVGTIYTDSKYSPVTKVAYTIDSTRVGQDASYDKLTIEIWTNGGIKAQEAIALASHILVAHLQPIEALEEGVVDVDIMSETVVENVNEWLDRPIEDLALGARAYNGLKRANLVLISDVCNVTEDELTKARSIGKKSIQEIKQALLDRKLNFKSYE